MLLYVTIVALTLVIGTFAEHSVTNDATRCYIKNPDLENCVLRALNALRPLAKGKVKEINSLSFEPFVIPTLEVSQESKMVNYTIKGRNLIIRGMENFDIKDIKFDPETMTFRGRVEYSPVTLNTEYEIEGNVISIPLKGQGMVNFALGPINATVEVYGEMVKNNVATYYNPTGLKILVVADDIGMYFDGLFGQHSNLGRMTNEALNSNSKMIAYAITPVVEDVSEKVFLKSIKSISKKVLSYCRRDMII